MNTQDQLNEYNKLLGAKYQKLENEPYKISSFHISSVDNKIYVAIHPTSPNKRMLNITEEAELFFSNYSPV
jgi:hypothetical protein